jgi:uncharacterized protein YpuA (DUF1002 family)
MTVTVSTKTIEEEQVVKVVREVKTYNLEVTETQLIDLAALLGNCTATSNLFWQILDVLDEEQERKYRRLFDEFGEHFSGIPRLS